MQQYIMGLVLLLGPPISVSFLFFLFQLLKFVVFCQTTTQAISLGKEDIKVYIYVHIRDMLCLPLPHIIYSFPFVV
jgi:hypothetical protein